MEGNNLKNNNNIIQKYLHKDGIISYIIIPLISLLIGVIFSNLIGASFKESIIISLLIMNVTAVFEYNIRNQISSEKIYEKNAQFEEKIDDIKVLSDIQDNIYRTNHPYFKKWSYRRLEDFAQVNKEFFQGTHRTSPHKEDTFGIVGISETKKHGSIKAISVIEDYWKPCFAGEYLNAHKILINDKKVHIQRIFVLNKEKYQEMYSQMELQYNMGIDVYYIFSDSKYIDPSMLLEDFLIQDNQLLVQIFCKSHNYEENNVELITINPSMVNRNIEVFNRVLERSIKFEIKKVEKTNKTC